MGFFNALLYGMNEQVKKIIKEDIIFSLNCCKKKKKKKSNNPLEDSLAKITVADSESG